MRIYGLDFTSTPHDAKPIVCAACLLDGDVLRVHCLVSLASFDTFDNFLSSEGPWVAAIDFPFGQPRKLLEGLGWPMCWEAYVEQGAALGMQAFERLMGEYGAVRRKGRERHQRTVDRRAESRDPIRLDRTPVGRMFLRGAPHLLRSPACILPCRPNEDDRVVLEAYPSLVARRAIGRRPYKRDDSNGGPLEEARRDLMNQLRSKALRSHYGLMLAIDNSMIEEIVAEPSGDSLDAVLCALQAAWSWSEHERGWGIPVQADPLEGWIVDPALNDPGTDSRAGDRVKSVPLEATP